jgi:hypothetical protein
LLLVGVAGELFDLELLADVGIVNFTQRRGGVRLDDESTDN